jgi:RES domain-containing protein
MVFAYRMVRTFRSPDAFSGKGSYLFGGRWSSPGFSAVYLAETISLAALESLVQWLTSYGNDFRTFQVRIPNQSISSITNLPTDWRRDSPSVSTQSIGDDWFKTARFAVLRVPSVVVPTEFHYLLNPTHPDFKKMEIASAQPFAFDPSLTPAEIINGKS